MNARVYVETSIVSYLSARTSRDVVVAAHQQITRRWWRGRGNYSLFVSQVVLDEAALGDQTARARRLRALRGIPTLALTDEATLLAGELVRRWRPSKESNGRCSAYRHRSCSSSGLPPDLELQAHRQRRDAWYD